ncbi:uncharacterized protein LOC135835304 [Planococcus citri]|uniref:uncharacterized protein LOC135835304 n=1 Tax=Planococcus citri TaxID=170843 RepID=UPI0031F768B5
MKSVFKMHRTNVIIILSLTLIAAKIRVSNAKDSKIVFSATATEEDIELLDPIKPDEALPIILFDWGAGQIIPEMYVVDLAEVEINNGRIWSSPETMFLTIPPRNPIFFCPNPDENKNCLVPEPFEQPRALQCKRQPTPTMKYSPVINDPTAKMICGSGNEGTLLRFEYEICPPELPYTYEIREIITYSFCYDDSLSKTLFVHYRIHSPKLLSEKLLTREQELKFDQLSIETYDGKIHLHYKNYIDAQAKLKPSYKRQMFALPEHMAFYTWKKTTNHFINVALQHEKLFDLWNEIQDYIAVDATAMFASIRNVLTGVVEIPSHERPTKLEESQMYNMWITIVADLNLRPVKAIAILMNNFIDAKETDDLNHDTSTEKQQYIDKLCPKEADVCVESLKQKFTQVGGQVRCCLPTAEITSLLHSNNPIPIDRLLRIPNINL